MIVTMPFYIKHKKRKEFKIFFILYNSSVISFLLPKDCYSKFIF